MGEAARRRAALFGSAAHFAIVLTDRAGLVTDWNEGAEFVFGWTADEMIGRDLSAIFTADDLSAGRMAYEMKTAASEGRVSDERWHLRKDGSRFWSAGEMVPLMDGAEHLGFAKIIQDRTAAKIESDGLKTREERLRALYGSNDEGFCVLELVVDPKGQARDYRILEVNRAFERHTGLADAAGRWMLEIAPEHEPYWFETFGRVARTGTPERFERQARTFGDRWFEGYAWPMDEAGGTRVAVLFSDVTGRKLHEATLLSSEAKWRGLFEHLHEGFSIGTAIRDANGTIVDWRYDDLNASWGRLLGVDAQALLGRTIREAFPGIEEEWVEGLAGVVESEEPRTFLSRVGPLDRWFEGTAQPMGGDTFSVIFLDVTERIRGGEKIAELDERRRLATDVGEVGLWELDFTTRNLSLDTRMRQFLGTEVEILTSKDALIGTHPADRGELEADVEAMAAGTRDTISRRVRILGIEDGVERTIQINGRSMRDGGNEPVRAVGAARDISDRVAADERRTVLNAELAHRLKNTLALVSSIVTQTLRTAPDIPSARKTVLDRIQALSKAHDALMTGHRDAASVRAVVLAGASLHDDGGRVEPKGPEIPLGPKASLTLSLIVHELSTNANKHGALSVPEGRVEARWRVLRDKVSGEPLLHFQWHEEGGPRVSPPTRKSFGTRLIEMGLSRAANAQVELDYRPSGVICRIVAPLGELMTEGEADG